MEQMEAVWNGVFLGDRRDSEHRILLYQLEAFYVEAYYHLEYNTVRRFRSFSILSILTFITLTAFAQTEIKLEDVKSHICDSVKLIAKIYGGKYLESAQGTPTFLNVGNKYPNAPFNSGDMG